MNNISKLNSQVLSVDQSKDITGGCALVMQPSIAVIMTPDGPVITVNNDLLGVPSDGCQG